MKQNEPVKTGGIGKMQVAFNVGNVKSPLDAQTTDEISIDEQQVIEQKGSAVSFARAIASASSTSLKQDIQNNCFEMSGIASFFLSTGGISAGVINPTQGADLNWLPSRVIVDSPLFEYNAVDRFLYVKKPGWYLVRVFMFAPVVNAAHDWAIRFISNVTLDSPAFEVYTSVMDWNHTNKHPYVNGTTIFNAPATVTTNQNGYAGFKIRLHSSASNINFNSSTTYASLQVIRLSDLEHSTRLINYQV